MRAEQLVGVLEKMVEDAKTGRWGQVSDAGHDMSALIEGAVTDGVEAGREGIEEVVLGYYDQLIILVAEERDDVSRQMKQLRHGKKRTQAYLQV